MILKGKNSIEQEKLECILLVDDNEFTNIFNKQFLRKNEIAEHVFAVKNGQEALDYLTHQGKFGQQDVDYPKPDIIFLDINMPIMDGWEFLEEFQALTKSIDLSSCLIVILTTSPNPEDEKRAKKIIEVADYKIKPITVKMIEDIIKKKTN